VLADAFLLMRIALFAAVVPWIARLPIPRLRALVEPPRFHPHSDPTKVERIIRCTESVCRIGSPLIAQRCMTRGLTLYYFLRRAGVDASLVFGAGRVQGQFAGHCWLVRDGEPYLEKTDPRGIFTPVYTFNDSTAAGHQAQRVGEAIRWAERRS
jgi:hypothetical protein